MTFRYGTFGYRNIYHLRFRLSIEEVRAVTLIIFVWVSTCSEILLFSAEIAFFSGHWQECLFPTPLCQLLPEFERLTLEQFFFTAPKWRTFNVYYGAHTSIREDKLSDG